MNEIRLEVIEEMISAREAELAEIETKCRELDKSFIQLQLQHEMEEYLGIKKKDDECYKKEKEHKNSIKDEKETLQERISDLKEEIKFLNSKKVSK